MSSGPFEFSIFPDKNGVCRVVIPLRQEAKWEQDGIIERWFHGTVVVPVRSAELESAATIAWTCGVPFQVVSGPARASDPNDPHDPGQKMLDDLLTEPLPTREDEFQRAESTLTRIVRPFEWTLGETDFYKCTFLVKLDNGMTDEWDPHVIGHRDR